MRRYLSCLVLGLNAAMLVAQQPSTPPSSAPNPFTTLMVKAKAHADEHHDTGRPVLSPVYISVLNGQVDVAALHSHGIRVVVWTPDDVETMRKLIEQYHVDGIITDNPEMLMSLLAQLRSEANGDSAKLHVLDGFESSAHRGGRADRPENTLPSFENGIDSGVSVLETDTYVTTDGVSAIWHDPYYNPNSCRRVDGQPYTLANRVFLHDISMKDAVKTFICDKTPYAEKGKENFSGKQKNDLSLSPVAVAFAKKEHMPSPYSPTNAAQLFRFMKFYTWYYAKGPGKSSPLAKQRAAYGARVRVAPETKISSPETAKHAQNTPQQFVDALGGAIRREHMEGRAEIQSFYYPTLLLFQEQYPMLSTYYLTAAPSMLYAASMPAELKVQ